VKSTSDQASSLAEKKAPIYQSKEASKLAQLLKAEILRNKPDYRITPAQERKWVATADLMIRRDRRTPERIAELIRWVQGDEFWMSNIVSMDKLREKFDVLELKANGSHQPAKTKPVNAADQVRKSLGLPITAPIGGGV